MARLVKIYNEERSLCVEVAPDNGGMITQIRMGETEILHLNLTALELSPMSAGGNPVLFPFASKTRGDCYELEGQTYGMPMHGLVKNAAWGIREYTDNKITLYIDSNESCYHAQFPYSFTLEVTYEVSGNQVHLKTAIHNMSDKPMPHAFGWHPYFKTTDKTQLDFQHEMTVHYDYAACVDKELPGEIKLEKWWDDVFHTSDSRRFRLRNEADGYEVCASCDEIFQVLTVCTWVEGSVCIEPWCGIPDAIHQNRFLNWVEPKSKQCFEVVLDIKLL